MYHVTRLGSYSTNVRQYADLDGYVPETGDRPQDFVWPSDYEWDDDSWDLHVEGAARETAEAEAALAQWRAES